MLIEIETSTIISYWACKHMKASSQKEMKSISFKTIENLGLKLEHAHSAIRVNIGKQSVNQFRNQCRENIEINENKIILKNLHQTQMKRVLRRNFPNYATFELLESILSSK